MRHASALATAIAVLSLAALPVAAQQATVTLDPSVATGPTTGRLFVIFGRTDAREPRFQAGSYGGSVPFYGMDVDAWKPGRRDDRRREGARISASRISRTCRRATTTRRRCSTSTPSTTAPTATPSGCTPTSGRDSTGRSSPGNLVSEVVKVHFDPAAHTTVKLALTKKLPPLEPPADTRWVKHVKMKSELLSKFWGAPVYIGATVLVPKDFDESSTARYPAVYNQGHFGLGAPFGFVDPTSPSANARGGDGRRTRRRAERVGSDADERAREWFRVW